jgi:periplasmic protein TonB
MFDTTTLDILESAPRSRGWTTAFSFLLQAIAVSVLLLIPLLYTEALPALHYSEQLTVPPGPRPPRVMEIVATPPAHSRNSSALINTQLLTPQSMPPHAITIVDPPNSFSDNGPTGPLVPYSTGSDMTSDNMKNLLAANRVAPPRVDLRREPLRISTLSEGALLHRVQPVYPPNARATRTQGPVVLAALIDTDGRIINLRLVSGHPLLVNAAMDAVKQWRYRPYILNSQPIEVETQITVVFSLN